MINPMMLVMSWLGRLLERPALPRARHRMAGTGGFTRFGRLSRVYSADGGAEDCD